MRFIHLLLFAIILTPYILYQYHTPTASYNPAKDQVMVHDDGAVGDPSVASHEEAHRRIRVVGLIILLSRFLIYFGLVLRTATTLGVARPIGFLYALSSFLDEAYAYFVTVNVPSVFRGTMILLQGVLGVGFLLAWRYAWWGGRMDKSIREIGLMDLASIMGLGVLFWLI